MAAIRPAIVPNRAFAIPPFSIRIAFSLRWPVILKVMSGQEKNTGLRLTGLIVECCRVALDLLGRSRHGLSLRSSLCGRPMRDFSTAFKTFGAVCGALLATIAASAPAKAANPLEMNFWLSGPKYEGRVAPCEAAVPTIVSRFQE